MTTSKKAAPAEAAKENVAISNSCDSSIKETLTILETLGPVLTKTFKADGSVSSYDQPANFKVKTVEITGWPDLIRLLSGLHDKPKRCLIRGKLTGTESRKPGTYVRTNANFSDQPLHWFMVDVDGYEPDFAMPTDPAAVEEYIEAVLPAFKGASYYWHMSSSAGQSQKLKCHIHFLSKTPHTSAQMKAWSRTVGKQVDGALYSRVQVHFTADPIYEEGRTDPVAVRAGFHQGEHDFVDLVITGEARETGAGEGGHDMKLVDPSEKDGIIGLFHRTYSAEQVLLELLEDFDQVTERRYTWHGGGGTPEGVWVHEDGMHVSSSHNTWPITGIANLWDLVRIFKFGHLDQAEDDFDQLDIDSRDIQAKPSQLAMLAWAGQLPELQTELAATKTKKIGDLVLFDIAKILDRTDDLEALAEELEFDHEKISQVFAAMAFNPINSKFWLMTPNFGVVLSGEKDIHMLVREHYGRFMNNTRAVVERTVSELNWTQARMLNTVKEVEKKPSDYLVLKTKAYRQTMKTELEVDMFSATGSMRYHDGIATLVFSHKPFLVGEIDDEVIKDYKVHFPEFDDFITLLAASRFASSRKKSHLWLNCESDWGKSFLMGALARLGLVVETSVGELAKMLEGGPVGKTIDEFKRVWCLAIDEFKGVTREVKQMSEYINFAPKGLASVQAPLYLKLFMSAESVDSLASKDSGIEDQFANRFLYVTGKGSIETRALFMESKGQYLASLVSYIGQRLNEQVEYFRSIGADAAADAADDEIAAMYEKYRIDRKFDRLSAKLGQIARSFAEDCAEAYAVVKRHDRGTKFQREAGPYVFETPGHGLCLTHPVTVINLWIEDTYGRSEGGKLNYKKEQIIEALGGAKTIACFGKDRKKGVVLNIPVPVDDVEGDFND